MKRHKDALGIMQGARNVRAIARSLVEASDEAAREGIGAEQDAAVRMMVHQLAKVCNVDEIKFGYDPATLKDIYCTLMGECEARANEISLHPEPSHAAPEKKETMPQSPVTTVEHGETVAVVLHDRGAQRPKDPLPESDDEMDGFAVGSEQRRGFLSRFLFKGD
ncbi:hypothetical protein LPW11_09670 [Geomonas sp. RF6]|uniref:hypothetical protein n=1 Tax=Geomonas sp. RF6 TaxID=2897342 RepID=UPI001E3E7A1A|nr:hypothetical protein [Geomonas sp. RF6]UFS72443.1 hypothetical protein LPW11_09670 [Geomonas sp. RF6]